jgi:hypothetical protein
MIHDDGVVVAQTLVPDDTNEITQVGNLVKNLRHRRGKAVIKADAAHTQYKTAILLRKCGIDYVLTVKGNQPTLHRQVFERCLPLLQETPGHEEEERSHGRISAVGRLDHRRRRDPLPVRPDDRRHPPRGVRPRR